MAGAQRMTTRRAVKLTRTDSTPWVRPRMRSISQTQAEQWRPSSSRVTSRMEQPSALEMLSWKLGSSKGKSCAAFGFRPKPSRRA
ncbi:hypothetical protein D3C87_1558490 [compost metagenome]